LCRECRADLHFLFNSSKTRLAYTESCNSGSLIVASRINSNARCPAQGAYWEFFRTPKRVRRVRIEGLRMFVSSGSERIENAARPGSPEQSALIIDQIIADGTVLEFASGQSGKEPLKFEIHKLTLNSVADDRPLSFHAALLNASLPEKFARTRNSAPCSRRTSAKPFFRAPMCFNARTWAFFQALEER
jgi:hypothetical protein